MFEQQPLKSVVYKPSRAFSLKVLDQINPLQNSFGDYCNSSMMDPVTDAAPMDTAASAPAHLDMSQPSANSEDAMKSMAMMTGGSHMMSADDPDNPQNFRWQKRVYVSAAAFGFAWVVYVVIHNNTLKP